MLGEGGTPLIKEGPTLQQLEFPENETISCRFPTLKSCNTQA